MHASTSKMKAGPRGSLRAAAGNSPARAWRGPLGTAPNPHLLQQEQIKGPRGVGRRGQTPAAADQSPRRPFVPGEEANPNSGARGRSEAPPSSLPGSPGVGSLPAPSTGAWRRSRQPQWVHPCLCFSFPSPSLPPGCDSSRWASRRRCRQGDTWGSVPSTTQQRRHPGASQ